MGQFLHAILKLPDNNWFIKIMYQGLVKMLDGFIFGPKKDLLFDTICNAVFSIQ